MLSLFAAVPTLISTLELIYLHRWDLVCSLRRFPGLCWVEWKYLILGIEPDPPARGSLIPYNVIPSSDKPTLKPILNTLRDQTITCFLAPSHPRPLLPPDFGPATRRRGADGSDASGLYTLVSDATSRNTVCGET